MKRLLLIVMLLIFISPIICQPTIKVGYMPDAAPISFIDKYGNVSGFFTDIIVEIANLENINLKFIPASFSDLQKMIIDGDIDIMMAMIKTPEREELFTYNKQSAMTSWTRVYTAPDKKEINNILDVKDKKIGLMYKDQNGINFINICEAFNIDFKRVYYTSYDLMIEGILNNECDGGVFFSLHEKTNEELRATDIIISPNKSYFIIKKDNKDLYYFIDLIDDYLYKWENNENSIYHELLNKYFNTIKEQVLPQWLRYVFFIGCISIVVSFILLKLLTIRIKKQSGLLSEKDDKIQKLFNMMNQGVMQLSDKGIILDVNTSIKNLFNIDQKVIGTYIDDLHVKFIEENGSIVSKHETILKIIENKKSKVKVLGIYEDKRIKWLNVTFLPEIINNEVFSIYLIFDDITDLKLALNAIEESNEEKQNIIDNMNSGFAYHKMLYKDGEPYDYKFIKTNNKFHELTGYSKDAVGKNISEVFPGIGIKGFIEEYVNVAETQIPIRIEKYIEDMGKWFDISAYSPKVGYFATIFNDITDRKNNEKILQSSENALRENQKRLSTTFESIGDGVITFDNELKVSMMNKVAKDILEWENGYYGEDLSVVFDLKNINIDGHSIKDIALNVLKGKEPYFVSKAILHINGKEKIIEDSIAPIYNGDEIYGLVVVFRDITEQVKNKTINQELETQLYQSQKMESIGQFSGGIAHNFNNILTAITGYVSLIESNADENFKFYDELNEINVAVKRAAALTSQLLTVSRKQTVNTIILNPNDVLNNLMSMMKSISGENIEIETNFNSTKLIKADQNQLEQILLNFIANSKHAMKDSKIKKIVIETKDYYVYKEYSDKHLNIEEGEYIVMSFTDSGKGINKDIKNKIFEPFFTTKEEGKGTGLGLSTVYGIIKQNKAAINVYSEEGIGTTFKIFWPTTNEDATVKENKKIYKQITSVNNETILFIEDESSFRKVSNKYLTSLGYNVILAENGEEAIKLFNNNKIDIIVSDVIMPVMSGPEFYEIIKKDNDNIKIIFTSGYSENYLINNKPIVNNGEYGFLNKPYSLKLLAEKVREMLDN